MDPLLWCLRVIPQVALLSAYVDDLAAGMRGIMGYKLFVQTLDNYRTISGIEVTRRECYQAYLSPCDDFQKKLIIPKKGCSFQDDAINIKAQWTLLTNSDTPLPNAWDVFIYETLFT
eukprot:12253565-Heterocapsa_arctica.AAC.1